LVSDEIFGVQINFLLLISGNDDLTAAEFLKSRSVADKWLKIIENGTDWYFFQTFTSKKSGALLEQEQGINL